MPYGAACLDAFAHHARGCIGLAQNEVGERLASEISAEIEAAAAQSGNGSRGVLLVSGQRKAAFHQVIAMGPGKAASVIEFVGNIFLIIEVAISEGSKADIGEGKRRGAFELRSGQRIVDAELAIDAILARVGAALHVLRTGK